MVNHNDHYHKLNSLTVLNSPGDCEEDRRPMKASDNPTFTGCSVELIFSKGKGTCYEKPHEGNWTLSKPCLCSSVCVCLIHLGWTESNEKDETDSRLCSWRQWSRYSREQSGRWKLRLSLDPSASLCPTVPQICHLGHQSQVKSALNTACNFPIQINICIFINGKKAYNCF